MGILPFYCHQCHVDFQPHEGGRCEGCSEWFCLGHLHRQAEAGTYCCTQCDKENVRPKRGVAQALLYLRGHAKKY